MIALKRHYLLTFIKIKNKLVNRFRTSLVRTIS